MKSNFLYFGGSVVLFIILFFVFRGSGEIKNYPSNGTDIIAFGDSLVQGVGATSEKANFVSILSRRIGKPIINLGVSGNTTIDGLARLNELDKYNPKVVILLLGGNDYLKKVPIDETFSNLEKIIKNIQNRGAVVVLLGIRGGLISDKFDEKFEDLSSDTQTAFVSNVLDGLLTKDEFMSDAIHPNDTGYAKIATRVYPVLQKLVK
ncbi:MAG: acyl-CoA thioesterase I [Parcubacteria bacterium C7867-003]|nr:MAG: acyl-CoA thioesterase I [Parcubacteria bacterium C7867-003]